MNEFEQQFTELAGMANSVHEIFVEYVRAGFTEDQAMELLKAHIVAAVGGSDL